MTQDKKLKRQIRSRAKQTGESYATARRQTLAARARKKAPPLGKNAKVATGDAGALGAVRDAKCVETTGHGLEHWFGVLDAFDAATKGHTAAARHLRDEHSVSAWYSQGITVAYERARGLRAVNQTSMGFEVSVSRVLPETFEKALRAISHSSQRSRWLSDVPTASALTEALDGGKRRFKKTPGKARLVWPSSAAHNELVLESTADGRSRIVARCTRMSEFAQVETQRGVWRAILDALRNHLRQRAA